MQKSLYDRAYTEAHSIVGGASRAILAYSVKFEKSLPRRFAPSTQTELLEAMRRHRFTLYGDFHTLRQSQRGLLRLLRAYVEKQRTSKVIIALEMFKAIDQDMLDGYLAGSVPEAEFLDSVNYAAEWGFPWANFRMILEFAKARRLKVIGINSENAGRDSLLVRDKFAARCLVDAALAHPNHKIVCLIGEYHLADGHLPKALTSELKRRTKVEPVLRVLNNVDQYYFQLDRTINHSSTEYLRLRKDFYCIMNSPPWMKWQSFAIWDEVRNAGESAMTSAEQEPQSDLDLYTEDSFDLDYQFLHFVRNLASFMELKIDPSDIESFHLHYSPHGDFLGDLVGEDSFSVAEATPMLGRAGEDGVYFVSRTNTVLLTSISINNLAEAASEYLHSLLTGFDDTAGASAGELFYRRVLKSAVGMLGSKLLNPRRKAMELHHLRQLVRRGKLGQTKPRGPAAHVPAKIKIAEGVLRFDRWLEPRLASDQPWEPPPRPLMALDNQTNHGLSRALGQMLGFALYKKVLANKLPAQRIRRLFKKRLAGAAPVWQELMALYRLMR